MTFNWCHGPNCHTHHTLSRIRGSKGNKVLRTIKIKQGRYNWGNDNSLNHWDFFCNQSCLMDFIKTHITSVIAIAPRREALETPIKVEKEKDTNWRGDPYTRTNIIRVDNA
jgi:hypothetical protein